MPVRAIEQVNESLLAGLRDGIDYLAIVLHCQQHRRRWKIPIPDVVLDALKMPDSFSGFRVERQQAVGEKVVAHAIAAVKIERG